MFVNRLTEISGVPAYNPWLDAELRGDDIARDWLARDAARWARGLALFERG